MYVFPTVEKYAMWVVWNDSCYSMKIDQKVKFKFVVSEVIVSYETFSVLFIMLVFD